MTRKPSRMKPPNMNRAMNSGIASVAKASSFGRLTASFEYVGN